MRNNEPLKHEVATVNDRGEIELIDIHTGEVIINLKHNQIAPHEFVFNYEKAIMICQLIKEGKTLNQIALMPQMPPLHVITHWQRSDRMFAEEMKLARTARSEFHHEKVLDLAQKAANGDYSKDQVPSIKLGAELYRWSAERANPERYGNKVTHEGSTEKPILMRVINTGISRTVKEAAPIIEAEIKEPSNDSQEIRDISGIKPDISISTGISRKEADSGEDKKGKSVRPKRRQRPSDGDSGSTSI